MSQLVGADTDSGVLGDGQISEDARAVRVVGARQGPLVRPEVSGVTSDFAALSRVNEGGIVTFPGGSLAVVVGPGGWMREAGERGEEERAFELFVAAFGWMLAADAGAGASGDRGEACVGGQVSRGRERGAVADFEEDAGCGPDPDAGHRGQDLGKRVCIKHPLDLAGDLVTLAEDVAEAVGQPREDLLGRGGARNGHGLLVQGGQDLLDEASAHPRGVLGGDLGEFAAAGLAQPGWSTTTRTRPCRASRSNTCRSCIPTSGTINKVTGDDVVLGSGYRAARARPPSGRKSRPEVTQARWTID